MRLLQLHARLLLVASGVLAIGGGVAFGYVTAPAQSIQLVAHVQPEGGYTADVFAHRGHAYLSSWRGRDCPADGVRVYSLADPRTPAFVSVFADVGADPALANTWTEKTIVQHVETPSFSGELAVTSFQACRPGAFQGFGLYDVTNPAQPRKLGLYRLEPRGSHEIWLQPRGRRAYVYTAILQSELRSAPDYDEETGRASRPGRPDFRIFDVTDPVRGREVSAWGAWQELGIPPNLRRGRLQNRLVHSVITNRAATRAYLSYWDLGTVVLDISNPARPRYLGRTAFTPAEGGNAHSAALAHGERVLVETHELRGGYPTLWDVSKPSKPRRLAAVRMPELQSSFGLASSVHDPKVRGNLAYFSWYERGVVVADISRPAKPRVVAEFKPPGSEDVDGRLCGRRRCSVVWGVALSGEYILASDMVGGLWVLKLT